jgi:hypothetical protein
MEEALEKDGWLSPRYDLRSVFNGKGWDTGQLGFAFDRSLDLHGMDYVLRGLLVDTNQFNR